MTLALERTTDAWTLAPEEPGAGWRTWVAVDAPAALPEFRRHGTDGLEGEPCLEIQLADDAASFGKWISPPAPVRAGTTYRLRIWQRLDGVAHPDLSAPALVTWRGETVPPWSRPWNAPAVDRGRDATSGYPEIVDRHYLRPAGATAGTWRLLELTVPAPEGAQAVEIEGWLRHAPGARARFGGASVEEVPARPPRIVTLGTTRVTPASGTTLEDNRQLLVRMVAATADQSADVVCLPENALIDGTGLMSSEAAEPLDGPTVAALSRVAADRRVWVVGQFPQRDGHRLYNTAVLIDRLGAVAGVYHKMHLTIGEWERGVVPGEGPVVVETEIGRLGVLVCFDLHFPEASRLTALAGAEVIFGPTIGDRWAPRRDTVTRAHAVTNGVFVVTSLVKHPSDIVDPEGRLVAQATEPNSVAVAKVDLDYKLTTEGRKIGADNGFAPGSYWPTRRSDLYAEWRGAPVAPRAETKR